ncbi:MAG: undecaprenyldiphospho-muramoylpentapeptide beta-N-acetylglucosaminyltransferase [Candidatus Hinthialibacter sp.]
MPSATRNSGPDIIITGGGTGGHLYPALAVAQALLAEKPDLNLLFICRDHERDRQEIKKWNIPYQAFPLEGLRRKITPGNICAMWKFAQALRQCRLLMKRRSPGVVFGVGGYVAAPAMTAGKLSGWKVTLHEQNTVPGLVNRLMAPRCDRVFLTFDSTRDYWPKLQCMTTGLPLRRELLEASKQNAASPQQAAPSVLLIGGSQGARKLVEIGLQALKTIQDRGIDFQAVVQTGERNFEWAQSLPQPEGTILKAFIFDMAQAYRDANVVISRAGSGSLAEIALWGLPSILVPYPFASENHQTKNAQTWAAAGAAFMIEEKDLTSARLADHLAALLSDADQRTAMSRRAAALARRDAAHMIAGELVRLLDE